MTKKEIVRRISEELGLKQTDTKEVVQRTFDAIIEALATEQRVELRNFGVFEVKKRAARKARNPKTGEEVLARRDRSFQSSAAAVGSWQMVRFKTS